MNIQQPIFRLFKGLNHDDREKLDLLVLLVQLQTAKTILKDEGAFKGLMGYFKYLLLESENEWLHDFLELVEERLL